MIAEQSSYDTVNKQVQKSYGEGELNTWKTILQKHALVRREQIIDLFHQGLEELDITEDRIPRLEEINEKLMAKTGFKGVCVEGLEEGNTFFPMTARREFPVGNFIRDDIDLNYTPAPDIVHDVYGHLPFFIDKDYADFCQKFGEMACEFYDNPEIFRQFERLFWFTIEFGMIKTEKGLRIFGAGIASSIGECNYALSGEPELVPFDLDTVRHQDFRIDQMQPKLFVLESTEQLYNCLDEFYEKVSQ